MSIWSTVLIKYTNKDTLLLLTWTVYVAQTFDRQLEQNRRQLWEILTDSREFRIKKKSKCCQYTETCEVSSSLQEIIQ